MDNEKKFEIKDEALEDVAGGVSIIAERIMGVMARQMDVSGESREARHIGNIVGNLNSPLFVAGIENEFHIKFSDKDLADVKTVNDLAATVKGLLER